MYGSERVKDCAMSLSSVHHSSHQLATTFLSYYNVIKKPVVTKSDVKQ